MFVAMPGRAHDDRPGVEASQTRLQAQARPRPVRVSKSGHAVEKSIQSDDPEECVVAVKDSHGPSQPTNVCFQASYSCGGWRRTCPRDCGL